MSKPGPTQSVSNQELIGAVRTSDVPVTTAQKVGDQVGYSREEARKRLNQLAEAGSVERDRLNGNVVVYWLSD